MNVLNFLSRKKSSNTNSSSMSSVAKSTPENSGNTHQNENNFPLLESGKSILNRPECKKITNLIKQEIKVEPEYFDKYYMSILENVAAYCQNAPASREKHHTYPFGLIEHLLEVCLYSLRASRNYVYNPTGRESEIEELAPLFAYSIVIAACLHDLAKIFTDNRFEIRPLGQKKFFPWHPVESLPPNGNQQIEYRFRRKLNPKKRDLFNYSTHSVMASSLLGRIVPKDGLRWLLTAHPLVETHLYHALAGDYENAAELGASLLDGDKYSAERGKSDVSTISSDSGTTVGKIKGVVADFLENPKSYGMTPSIDGSGFVNLFRVDDFIYVSCSPLVKALSEPLRNAEVTIPSKDEKKTGSMIAEHVGVIAPSGDSMWWLRVIPAGKTESDLDPKKKDILWAVFDATQFPNVAIPKSEGVGFKLATRSKAEDDQEVDKKAEQAAKESSAKEKQQQEIDKTKTLLGEDIVHVLVDTPSSKVEKKTSPSETNPSQTNTKPSKAKTEAKSNALQSNNVSAPPARLSHDSANLNEDTDDDLGFGTASTPPKKKIKQQQQSSNYLSALAKLHNKDAESVDPGSEVGKKPTYETPTASAAPINSSANGSSKGKTRKPKKARKSSLSLPTRSEVTSTQAPIKKELPPSSSPDLASAANGKIESEADLPVANRVELNGVNVKKDVQSGSGSEPRKALPQDAQKPINSSPLEVGSSEEPKFAKTEEPNLFEDAVTNLPMMVANLPKELEVIKSSSSKKDEVVLGELISKIQQGIDSGAIRFNRSGSPLFNTQFGLFLVSPKFFNGSVPLGDKDRTQKLRNAIVGSSYAAKRIGTREYILDAVIKVKKDSYPLAGFMLVSSQAFGLTYKGKPLPIVELELL